MPLLAPVMEAALLVEIKSALTEQFASDTAKGAAYPPVAQEAHAKLAAAIAKAVAKVVVEQITTQAVVLPGIPTAGSPASQVTVGPGKIG